MAHSCGRSGSDATIGERTVPAAMEKRRGQRISAAVEQPPAAVSSRCYNFLRKLAAAVFWGSYRTDCVRLRDCNTDISEDLLFRESGWKWYAKYACPPRSTLGPVAAKKNPEVVPGPRGFLYNRVVDYDTSRTTRPHKLRSEGFSSCSGRAASNPKLRPGR